jgi:hypothetical protein
MNNGFSYLHALDMILTIVVSARPIIFKTLMSGISTELTLITPRTSSTETLAKADSGPKQKRETGQI